MTSSEAYSGTSHGTDRGPRGWDPAILAEAVLRRHSTHEVKFPPKRTLERVLSGEELPATSEANFATTSDALTHKDYLGILQQLCGFNLSHTQLEVISMRLVAELDRTELDKVSVGSKETYLERVTFDDFVDSLKSTNLEEKMGIRF